MPYYNPGIFYSLFEDQMINLVNGKHTGGYNNLPYSPIMRFDGGDGMAACYGATGPLIAGLLLGYPIESSISLIEVNTVFLSRAF